MPVYKKKCLGILKGRHSLTKGMTLSMKRPVLGVLLFTHFVNDFYFLLFPIFVPVLVQKLSISYFDASILMAIVAMVGGVLQSPVGYWADLYRKRVVFISIGFLLYALGALILGLSNGFALLLAAACLLGLATTTYHPQSTNLITREFTRKGRVLGIHGVGGQLGKLIAPMLMAFLISRLGWRMAAITLTLPALLAMFLSRASLEEPGTRGEKGLTSGLRLPIIFLVVILGLRGAIFQGIIAFLPSFLTSTGSSLTTAGVLTGAMMGMGLIAEPLGGTLGDRFSKRKIIFSSFIGLTAFFSLFYFMIVQIVQGFPLYSQWLILPLLGMGFCVSATYSVGLAFSAELAWGERVGTSVGVVAGGGLIISTVTLPIVGYLIDKFGFIRGFSLLGVMLLTATLLSGLYLRLDPDKWRFKRG